MDLCPGNETAPTGRNVKVFIVSLSLFLKCIINLYDNYPRFTTFSELSYYDHDPYISVRTGAKRSGLFCVVSTLLEKLDSDGDVSVVNTVRRVQFRRPTALTSQVSLMTVITIPLFSYYPSSHILVCEDWSSDIYTQHSSR